MRSKTDQDATENISWTDDEVDLLLGVVRLYNSQKDYEALEWESVKSKYEDIRKDFVELYRQVKSHCLTMWPFFTRKKIASKIKDPWKKYKNAVDSGRRSKMKPVRSHADKYPDSLKYLFTRQNIGDSTVFGYEVFTLSF